MDGILIGVGKSCESDPVENPEGLPRYFIWYLLEKKILTFWNYNEFKKEFENIYGTRKALYVYNYDRASVKDLMKTHAYYKPNFRKHSGETDHKWNSSKTDNDLFDIK